MNNKLSLNQVTVRVTDFEESFAFYTRIGLLPIVRRNDFYARFIVPGNEATFSIMHDEKVDSTTTINFEVEDVDAKYEDLKNKGVEFKESPIDQDWGWREVYFEDPDGNVLCIFEAGEDRLNPDWRLEDSLGSHVLTVKAFDRWLSQYKKAWERRDPEGAVQLFAKEAIYYQSPFEPPFIGRKKILGYWKAVPDWEKDIYFDYEIIRVYNDIGISKWRAEFKRKESGKTVQLDGIFEIQFNVTGLCTEFREWWHLEEL